MPFYVLFFLTSSSSRIAYCVICSPNLLAERLLFLCVSKEAWAVTVYHRKQIDCDWWRNIKANKNTSDWDGFGQSEQSGRGCSLRLETLLWERREVRGESFRKGTRIQAAGFPTVSIHIKRGRHLSKPLTSGHEILFWEAACRWTAYIPAPWNHRVNIKALCRRGRQAKSSLQEKEHLHSAFGEVLASSMWPRGWSP